MLSVYKRPEIHRIISRVPFVFAVGRLQVTNNEVKVFLDMPHPWKSLKIGKWVLMIPCQFQSRVPMFEILWSVQVGDGSRRYQNWRLSDYVLYLLTHFESIPFNRSFSTQPLRQSVISYRVKTVLSYYLPFYKWWIIDIRVQICLHAN